MDVPFPVSIPLLIADASDLVLGGLLQPTWGVYLNGTPVIMPAAFAGPVQTTISVISLIANLLGASTISPAAASTVEFEYAQDLPVSNYPQEFGAFQAYNKVTLPFDVKLRLAAGGPTSTRQAFLNTCLAIKDSFALFDVVTPEIVFTSVNCTHIDWRRSAKRNNTLIEVDLWFVQVPVVSATGFTNTFQPNDATAQGTGNVQPNDDTGFDARFNGEGAM